MPQKPLYRMKHFTYRHTMYACFIGYFVQAVIVNFAPLLFLTFQNAYGIPLSEITLLIAVNFGLQLTVDLFSVLFVDRLGYRRAAILAHLLCALGLISMTVLPECLPDPFAGILLSVMLYAMGGGLLEVLISPIVEACPNDNKSKAMSLLHSFYCWGCVAAIVLSTVFFAAFGTENWKFLALLWAALPLGNALFFARVPIASLLPDGEKGMTLPQLAHQPVFWTMLLMMMAAGASEQAVAQWASAFAEQGLGISKTAGDLAGPALFCLLMGVSRLLYGKYGEKLPLTRCMLLSSALCIAAYALISFSKSPVPALAGCGLCGFAVGIMWPGTFSMASAALPRGGTGLFALLALAGDLGCSLGPALVGTVSDCLGDDLKRGIVSASLFPVLLTVCLLLRIKKSGTDTASAKASSKNRPE